MMSGSHLGNIHLVNSQSKIMSGSHLGNIHLVSPLRAYSPMKDTRYYTGKFKMTPKVSVNFVPHVTFYFGVQKKEPQTAYPMCITWASHI